jgi:hypothetical protein
LAKVLLVVVLAVSLGQFVPSCGTGMERTGGDVIGWIADKYYLGKRQSFVVVINNVEYNVPDDFYYLVEVGDLVKSEGGMWSIVKKKGT